MPRKKTKLKLLGGLINPKPVTQNISLSPYQDLDHLQNTIYSCNLCKKLCSSRTRPVIGKGKKKNPQLLIVGEAPGRDEDREGIPFVGKSGQFLDIMLADFGFSETNCYYTNTVKCHPLNNRNPSKQEITNCRDYLLAEIKLIKPSAILAVGTIAKESLEKIDFLKSIPYLAIVHPAFLLRNTSKEPHSPKWNTWQALAEFKVLLEKNNS